jgi:hypothetical protein
MKYSDVFVGIRFRLDGPHKQRPGVDVWSAGTADTWRQDASAFVWTQNTRFERTMGVRKVSGLITVTDRKPDDLIRHSMTSFIIAL